MIYEYIIVNKYETDVVDSEKRERIRFNSDKRK